MPWTLPLVLLRHRRLQPLWQFAHRSSLVMMNYWASLLRTTGEREALDLVKERMGGRTPTLFDVGANVGDYVDLLLSRFGGGARIFAFEPSSGAFNRLSARFSSMSAVRLNKLALSDNNGERMLHSDADGSTISSLEMLQQPIRPFDRIHDQVVACVRLDDFCVERNIERIDFLKLDVEGHELSVLRGASKMLAKKAIDAIQFEFGEPNIDSRTFMRDFVDLLSDYQFYRIVPGGPVPWRYSGGRSEIFATINYLAIRNEER